MLTINKSMKDYNVRLTKFQNFFWEYAPMWFFSYATIDILFISIEKPVVIGRMNLSPFFYYYESHFMLSEEVTYILSLHM